MDGSVIGAEPEEESAEARADEQADEQADEGLDDELDDGSADEPAGRAAAGDGAPGDRDPAATETGARDQTKLRLAALCAVLAALFAAFAVWFSVESSSLNTDAVQNTALTDAQTSKNVQEQVSNDLNAIMSYDYKDPERTAAAARDVLRDEKLAKDYSEIINVLKEKGPGQKLAVQTKVVKSGVIELREDRAVVLALASQTYSKGEGAQTQATSARLKVSAELDGNRWRITDIKQY